MASARYAAGVARDGDLFFPGGPVARRIDHGNRHRLPRVGYPVSHGVGDPNRDGLAFRGVTSREGEYSIPSLPIGAYELKVQANGFKTFNRTGITLEVAQRLRLDVMLEIGATSDSVTVTSEVSRVQTDDSSLGTTVEQQRIEDLPLNGRQPFSLVNIVAGVQPTSISSNGFADSSNQGFSRIRFNGGPTLGNQFFLDGTTDTIPAITEISVVPMADAVEEFRVDTNDLKAEFGQILGRGGEPGYQVRHKSFAWERL